MFCVLTCKRLFNPLINCFELNEGQIFGVSIRWATRKIVNFVHGIAFGKGFKKVAKKIKSLVKLCQFFLTFSKLFQRRWRVLPWYENSCYEWSPIRIVACCSDFWGGWQNTWARVGFASRQFSTLKQVNFGRFFTNQLKALIIWTQTWQIVFLINFREVMANLGQ